MKVAVVGCGLIGRRRATVASQAEGDEVEWVVDVDATRAETLAKEIGCRYSVDWKRVVGQADLDVVVVATPNKYILPVALTALKAGKHVLCEKPPGRNVDETCQLARAAEQNKRVMKVGFNHRYHPAIWGAYQICRTRKELGEILFLRAIYGHGGRPGYDQEWRADAELSGGGELLDQGVHVIDLMRWFVGEFNFVFGLNATWHWDLGYFGARPGAANTRSVQLEDNAFATLRTRDGKVAQFHTSWTQWKNRFSFEVFCREGYARVEGLGGSYGMETLTVGRRKSEGGAPDVQTVEFSGPDLSWQAEWQEFRNAIREKRQPLASIQESVGTMGIIAALYRSSQSGVPVLLK